MEGISYCNKVKSKLMMSLGLKNSAKLDKDCILVEDCLTFQPETNFKSEPFEDFLIYIGLIVKVDQNSHNRFAITRVTMVDKSKNLINASSYNLSPLLIFPCFISMYPVRF